MTNQLNAVQTVAGDSSVPLAIAGWLACMVAVLWIALLIVKVVREIRGQPLASEVQADSAGKYVTKSQCEGFHRTLEGRLGFLDAQRITDAKDGAASRKGLYEEIKNTNKETRGHIEEVRKELSDKIDGMPDRVIAILRNFGVIGNTPRH